MNFFEKELRKIVEPICPDATYVGTFCFVPLGEKNRAKINFATSRIADHYDTLQIKIVNKNDGELDCVRLQLSDLLRPVESNNPFLKQSGVHIWKDGNTYDWYGVHPKAAGYSAITETVKSYVELFQDQSQEFNGAMQQGMTM